MATDKKISELPVAAGINANDISVLVNNGVDYQFSISLLLQFLTSNLSTGAVINFGTVTPQNNTGKNGDLFVKTDTGQLIQKVSGSWMVVYTLPAANGADGAVLYGSSNPSASTGKDLDTYINTVSGIFYLKTSGIWNQVFSMQTGPQGPKGDKGDIGNAGINGKTILSGVSNPSNLIGNDGDYYMNTDVWRLYGPKTAGVWGAGVALFTENSFAVILGNPEDNIALAASLNTKADAVSTATAISNEATVRGSADANLQEQINNLPSTYVSYSGATEDLDLATTGHGISAASAELGHINGTSANFTDQVGGKNFLTSSYGGDIALGDASFGNVRVSAFTNDRRLGVMMLRSGVEGWFMGTAPNDSDWRLTVDGTVPFSVNRTTKVAEFLATPTVNGVPLSTGNDITFFTIIGQPEDNAALAAALGSKVDKVTGYSLSQNNYTTSEKNKLATLSEHFKGKYTSFAALVTANPTGSLGDYAFVDAGVGVNSKMYIWDGTDNVWVLSSPDVIPDATETSSGLVELATVAEALARTDDQRAMTALKTIALILDEKKKVSYQINPVSLNEVSVYMENVGQVNSVLISGATSAKLKIGLAGTYPAGSQTYPFAYAAGDRVFITYNYTDLNNASCNIKLKCQDN